MADIKVRDLTDTQTINTDNEIMVLTNAAQNQVQNITVENFITNVISSDSDNVIEQGTDGKLFVETPENITGDLADLSTTEKSSLVGAINEVNSDLATEVTNRTNAVSGEATTRANADNNLQSQIDAITAASDVTDIVGTYAELQTYDTTGLSDKSVIKVLQDESHQNETTYYRWVITGGVGAWVLIGEEGPYYTISQADSKFATQETIGNLNNLATSDKSSVVNAMNELASVLDPTQTADYIKNSKAIYSGEVSENALILPQIKEMAHSTFDLSKFTVVGSPNITDDGVASGFSSSNQVVVPNTLPTVTTNDKWSIKYKFTLPQSASSNQTIIRFPYGAYGYVHLNYSAPAIYVQPFGTAIRELSGSEFVWGATYEIENIFTGTNVITNVKRNGVSLASSTSELPSTPVTYELRYMALGWYNNASDPIAFTGSIDLKQFSITVDGVEVFSGNKTGIDTIKPDDYTVVGTPTISADGIASGFTNADLIETPSITQGSTLECYFRFNSDSATTTYNTIFSNYSVQGIVISFVNNKYKMSLGDGTAWVIADVIGTNSYDYNKWYYGKLEYKNGYYRLYISDDNQNWTLEIEEASTTNILPNSVMNIGNGRNRSSTSAFKGFIDLNAFKIYVDGNLVYQPCLKIPYTESKAGSKVVNAIYRDRINDMAEQFGYANYYTLSDADFTLPKGELYGMIEKRARDIAHPVAQPFYRFSDEINEDEVRLEGAEVDKGLYLAIEQDPYLSALCTAGSTSDKICLPDFRNRVVYGDVVSGYVEPELPNITGTISVQWGFDYSAVGDGGSGALYNNYSAQSQNGINWNASTTNSADSNIRLDASRSSSIYKDGATVKTAGIKARWLCRWK